MPAGGDGRSRLIAALDTASPSEAAALAAALSPAAGMLKLGLEFFVANGPDALGPLGPGRLFLDLKLHDIPATVAGAAAAAGRLGVAMLTAHASGGHRMIEAAREGLERSVAPGATRTRLLGVTVLTSLDAADLAETGLGTTSPADLVRRLAAVALASGADGLICSPEEVGSLRDAFGPEPLLVVPGIRPEGSARDDQARTATPARAIGDGASYLVVGRPITRAADPAAAARLVAAEIEEALRSRST